MKSLTDHELDKLACLESSHIYTASIRIKADDRRTYSFAMSHYIDGVVEANSNREANAPPERLVLRFTTGEVTVLGSGLERIETGWPKDTCAAQNRRTALRQRAQKRPDHLTVNRKQNYEPPSTNGSTASRSPMKSQCSSPATRATC